MTNRFRRSFLLAICAAAIGLSGVAQARAARKVHLFILSGQSNMARLDPNQSFTPTVTKALAPDEVIVVKSAQGGQPICRWYKQWKPPAGMAAPKEGFQLGDLYDKMMTSVRKAIGDKRPDTITFVWMQGENDAKREYGAVYAASMRGLIEQLRTDMNCPDIDVVIGRLSDFGNGDAKFKNWDEVRKAQYEVTAADPRAEIVYTDDLNGDKNALHYTREGYDKLGRRFAETALALMSDKPSTVTPIPLIANWSLSWWIPRHNEKLADISSRKQIDLVFIGDSITHGWEKSGAGVWDEYYKKRNALNLGYGGDRTENVIWRLRHGEADGYKAKLAVVMIGTNNACRPGCTPATVAEGIRVILDEWRKRQPQSKVLLLGIFPRGPTADDARRKFNQQVNAIICKYADDKTVFYLDIGEKFLTAGGALTKEIMPDRLHPHEKGYGIWAGAIEPMVRKLLGE